MANDAVIPYRVVAFVDDQGIPRTRLEEWYPSLPEQPTGLDQTTTDAVHPVEMPARGSYRNNARLYERATEPVNQEGTDMPMIDLYRPTEPEQTWETKKTNDTSNTLENPDVDAFVSDVEETYAEMTELLRKKRESYGPSNLLDDGMLGITARMGDKLGRIRNMSKKGITTAADGESLDDALRDIIGYATLALIHRKKGEL